MQFIPPTPQNSTQGFTRAFPAIYRVSSPLFGRCIMLFCTVFKALEGIPAHKAPSTDTRYNRHAGRCTGQHSRPIIIRYIRVQGHAPADGSASPPVQGQPVDLQSSTVSVWRPLPGGVVQRQGCSGRRGTIDGSRRSSFSGFRPIANRG